MQQQAVLLACSTESNITAWDLATATQLTQYKGNASGRGRVTRLGSDYLAAAQNSKDAIHFWTWHKDQVLQRCFTQEPLTALAASPNGAYLVGGGASGTLYCWEAFSGRLLRSWPAHYKAVSCLAFSDSGGLLVSAGEDTLVAAWLLAEVLDEQRDGPAAAAAAAVGMARVEPLHTWSEHTLPVTCIYLGSAAAGVVGGPGSCCYEGHSKAISSLEITPDGEQLVSGSEDGTARIWDLRSRQCLRSIASPNKAPVTAALLMAWPGHLGPAGSAGRQGPKRLQPLAALAKFAGAAGTSKPWEGLINQQQQGSGQGSGQQQQQQQQQQQDVAQLQQQVEQLQQQLQESRQVAGQWQALHGELHQFCTDKVLATGLDA
ncbi:hypothetical protein OEZ85_005302 [Tetradesmus obliquus]|uniref:Anaphase-promoting complex subunit 4 WD40 domain-containing protein n=1 Tax=Tetradesmus obliquus TaxID=3088 RepID=A0ABY8UHY1_TETOB|nr:hypothetical protein OEZ85_005302 [Tetradesmus obliquus]